MPDFNGALTEEFANGLGNAGPQSRIPQRIGKYWPLTGEFREVEIPD